MSPQDLPNSNAAGGPPAEPLRVLVGPTGVGKTELSLALAERAGLELLSMDSMLVYRGMDVGTAKPSRAERGRVPHHLVDLVAPQEDFTVARWLERAGVAERGALARGSRPLYVGGTMLYLKALVAGLFEGPDADPGLRAALEERYEREGPAALHAELARLDPPSAGRIHPNDRKRLVRALEVRAQTGLPLSSHQTGWGLHGPPAPARPRRLVGLTRPPEELERRMRARIERMLDAGWVEEAVAIRAAGGFSRTAAQALGYAEVLALGDGELDRGTCVERITLRTRRFARKQRTWLRSFPELVWVELETGEDPGRRADEVLALLGLGPGQPGG